MDIAKPPGGFRVIEPDAVRQLIESYSQQWPRLPKYWEDIKARLKQTGHREGVLVPRTAPGSRTFIADGDRASDLPAVRVAYLVLGDTLTIKAVSVERK
jgi:hypothetical protein